jgi:putative nucleotidyltransferase with HDIG domain
MGGHLKFFKSRLAKRFFAMFVASALIPIMALALVSYYRVTEQLTDQALERLRQSSKSHALSIYERLLMADRQLQILQAFLPNTPGQALTVQHPNIAERNEELFTGLIFIHNGKTVFSWGKGVPNSFLEMASQMNLTKDKPRLFSLDNGEKWPTITIVRRIGSPGINEDYLIGAIDPSFLWGLKTGTILPPTVEYSVWDDQGRNVFSSLGFPLEVDHNPAGDQTTRSGGQRELKIQNELYFAFSWSAFLKPQFHVPYWTVMVMEPRDHILQPLHSFRMVFLSIVALSFMIVVFLTSRAIRRSLIPIDELMYGARQVANGLFSHRVVVKSRDEFQDLATAFNGMTHELDSQFKVLSARSDLDRAILSVLDINQIVSASLSHSGSFIPCSTAAISIFEKQRPLQGRSYIREGNAPPCPSRIEPFQLQAAEHALLLENRNWLRIDAPMMTLSHLQALQHPDLHHFLIFPVWVQNRLFALVSLGVNGEIDYSQKDLEQMRGFSDHLAVAFANSDLLRELEELSLGTLYALARTVDAKSSWTAGHSARVAQLAVDIAKVLESPQEVLDDLRRAALLHDIGKIGIPLKIIDKPGKLTAEEYDIIKNHPSIGARILSPIQAYAGIIPIVEQHHERYDGKGYPFGKRGDQIHPSARIMTLADSFDAMVSDRPYRPGLTQEQAICIISEEAGGQFDPRIVEAFNKALARRREGVFFEPLSESLDALSALISSSTALDAESSMNRYNEAKR